MEEVVLVDKDIIELLSSGMLLKAHENNIQPASLDIALSNICFSMKNMALPLNMRIIDLIKDNSIEKLDFDEKPLILYKGQTYLIFAGFIILPQNVRASFSPKSSIGRIDVMVRTIFDNSGFYDTIQMGGNGELWIQITPHSFNIRVSVGCCLTQMMLFKTQQQALTIVPSLSLFSRDGELLSLCLFENKILLTLHIEEKTQKIGFEAINTNEVIDLQSSQNDPRLFFKPITTIQSKNSLILEKDKFYILSTKERVYVSENTSAEMVPFSHHIGELRAHYAGFFDSNFFGISVLEIRSHETCKVIDGQPIALMKIFANTQLPNKLYGDANNHYQNQNGPQLAKFFLKREKRKNAM